MNSSVDSRWRKGGSSRCVIVSISNEGEDSRRVEAHLLDGYSLRSSLVCNVCKVEASDWAAAMRILSDILRKA